MQEQRTSVQSFPEDFEFDHGSNSSNSGMNQHIYLNNMRLNPAENQDLPGYVIFPGSASMSRINMANQDGVQLTVWSSGGQPATSVQHSHNHNSREETKIEHGCTSPPTVYAGGSPSIEERCVQPDNVLGLENASISLNTTQVDGKSFLQSSILNDLHQNSEYASDGISNEILESRPSPHPYTSGLSDPEHIPSSSRSSKSCRSSLGVGSVWEDDGRPGSSLDGRRLACKRKNFEGLPGQSSARGTTSSSDQSENRFLPSASYGCSLDAGSRIRRSSEYLSIVNSPEYYQPSFGTLIRGMASECDYSASAAGNAESSHRNFWARINHVPRDISLPNLWSAGAARHHNLWSQSQPSSRSIQFNQSIEPRPALATSSSQNRSHAPVVHGLCQTAYHIPWSGAANSRIGSSSSSLNSQQQMIATREETNSTSMSMNSYEDLISFTNIGQMTREPTNWTFRGSSIGLSGNVAPTSQVGPSLEVHPSLVSSSEPHRIPPSQYTRSSPASIHQSLFPSGSSDSGGQRTSSSLQRSHNSFSSLEAQQIRANSHGPQPSPHIQSAYMIDWQNDSILGAPLTIRSLGAPREGRSRMMLESVVLAGIDLHDRHRDMRLDVDNMTYEELLALEERIGNVSTGLSEETVLKCLRQRKYLLKASEEDEPCCICQEEYVEGEDLGTLDCGHNFHTVCIKQWLTYKNLCPICKNTALVT